MPAGAAATAEQAAARQALDLRNRLAWSLQEKLGLVRAAARFVFRGQPEIARLSTSTYERKKRAAQRRAEHKAPVVPVNKPA